MRTILPILPIVAATAVVACSSPPGSYVSARERWDAERPARHEPAPSRLDSPVFAEALAAAMVRNPDVRAASQRWRAAIERIPQVTSLPDPRLTFSPFLEEVETRAGPMDWRASLMQSFPWFGTLDLAGRQAVAAAEVAREQYVATRLRVEVELGEAWTELLHAREDAAIARDHRDLLVEWEPIARQRYAAGVGTHHDLTRAQVEVGILEDRLRASEDVLRPLRARINTILDRPVGAPLEPREELSVASVPPGLDAAVGRLDELNPALRARRRAVEAAELGVSLADLAPYPGFAVGIDYTAISSARSPVDDSGDDALAVSFGIDLPVFRDRDAAVGREARATLSAERGALASARNRLVAEIEMERFRLLDARRRLELYQGELIPLAEENVTTTLTAYQNDDAKFLDLVDAERVWLEFAHAVARAKADAEIARHRLRGLTGLPPVEEGP